VKRVLTVDDERGITEVLESRFQAVGYQTMAARDGKEALRVIGETRPDVIILDVMMPEQNGFAVCRALKNDPASRDIPVIFLTAKDTDSDEFWGSEAGGDAYITKPFKLDELVGTVKRLLGD